MKSAVPWKICKKNQNCLIDSKWTIFVSLNVFYQLPAATFKRNTEKQIAFGSKTLLKKSLLT